MRVTLAAAIVGGGFTLRRWAGQYSVMAVAAAALAIAASYAARPFLPLPWRTAGSEALYLTGVVGAVLLLIPAAYSFVKRGGSAEVPRHWLAVHIVAGIAGAVVITVHAAGGWTRPPALLVLLVYFLILQGAWARSVASAKLARVMASRTPALRGQRKVDKEALRRILDDKRQLLARLDAGATEAMFSPNRSHWLRRPFLTFRYVRLTHREAMIVGARGTVGRDLGNWRRLHLLATALLVAGIAVHVVTVTFFAGYVADGGPITWWHLAAWGG
jgi:hypothetical protein